MRIKIIITTIYHSQSDNQSEHTNQIIKIVLQYALEKILNADFINFLSEFKQMFNNNINTFIRQTLNEIIYEFNFADSFDMIADNNARKFEVKHKIHQQKTQDLIT